MTHYLKKIGAILSGKVNHINKVCAPEAINLYRRIEKLPMPYSLLFYRLMVQTYGAFTASFTVGMFSHCVKKLDLDLTRKVFGVYLCFATWIFTRTGGFNDFLTLFPNFNATELYSTLFKLIPYAEVIKKQIDEISSRKGEPASMLPIYLEEAIGKKAKPNNAADYVTYGGVYLEMIHQTLRDIADDLARGKTGKFD